MNRKRKVIIPFENALKDLLAWFKATHSQGVIIGGVATSLLSRPRTTLDIDALVIIDPVQWENFLKVGEKFGFLPRQKEALAFARRHRVLLIRHSPSGVNVDISFGALPFEEESLKRARTVKIGNLSIPLPTPEDLIIMKAVAHRTKDMADIETILETQSHLDYKRIRYWVKEFANVLETPEIYEDLEKLL